MAGITQAELDQQGEMLNEATKAARAKEADAKTDLASGSASGQQAQEALEQCTEARVMAEAMN